MYLDLVRNHRGTLVRWKLSCGHWRTRAEGRSFSPWLAVRRPRASWRRSCRSLDRASRGICGCCGRPGWSMSARRRSGASTLFGPSRLPSSMDGWPRTGASGSSGWMPCTPRWPGGTANEGAPDDRERAWRPPHPGQPANSRLRGHRPDGGRFDTDIEDLWSALTDPRRLARWHSEVKGDLRLGGTFSRRSSDGESTGRVDACDPPRRLLVTLRDADPQPG